MAQNTYTDIPHRVNVELAFSMLQHARAEQVLSRLGMHHIKKKQLTKIMSFKRPVPLDATVVAIVEGVAPDSTAFTYDNTTATLTPHGAIIDLTDEVLDFSEPGVLDDAAMIAGEQAAEMLEKIIWGAIRGGTSVTFANGTARNEVNTVLTLSRQRGIVATLKRNKAKPVKKMQRSGMNYGSVPTETAFIAVAHTDLEADIRNMAGFETTAAYAGNGEIMPSEIGRVENVRYITSPELDSFADAGGAKGNMMSTTGTSADVYPVVYMGKDAFVTTALAGEHDIVPTIVPAKPSAADVLAQHAYVGWKARFAAAIVNDTWIHRLEVGATNNDLI